jgi:hypothetical protein
MLGLGEEDQIAPPKLNTLVDTSNSPAKQRIYYLLYSLLPGDNLDRDGALFSVEK